jgi:predicted nucleotide-binding protein (sugar kinase/HSP70/actin superfamily)
MLFGDLMMSLTNQVRPYEARQGDVDALVKTINKKMETYFDHQSLFSWHRQKRMCKEILAAFKAIDTVDIKKPKVGIVGEIYVKYSPLGNNHLEQTLIQEDCEVVVPPLYDFFLYTFDSRAYDIKAYGGPKKERLILKLAIWYVEVRRNKIRRMMKRAGFDGGVSYKQLKQLVKGVLNYGTHTGEGWLLTAEMIDLIHHGAPNIVCTQPFGCLPNHIAGKGMFKKLKTLYPSSNIVAIDYDTSASKINQLNRINLMVSNAHRQLKKED